MTILISGGAGSGKSAFAERLAVQLAQPDRNPPLDGNLPPDGNMPLNENRPPHGRRLLYIAAMEPCGEEAAARIAKHREQRRGLGFVTVERYRDLAGLDFSGLCVSCLAAPSDSVDSVVLLEDLGNLCANELFDVPERKSGGGGADAESAVLSGLKHLRASCSHLVIVTNEVFSGGAEYAGDTDTWLRLLARVNRKTAALSDGVCEVVCGVPCWIRSPWRQEETGILPAAGVPG